MVESCILENRTQVLALPAEFPRFELHPPLKIKAFTAVLTTAAL